MRTRLAALALAVAGFVVLVAVIQTQMPEVHDCWGSPRGICGATWPPTPPATPTTTPATTPAAAYAWPTASDAEIAHYTTNAGGITGRAGDRIWTLYGDGRLVVRVGAATFRLTEDELAAYLDRVERSGVLAPRPPETPECCDMTWSGFVFTVDGRDVVVDIADVPVELRWPSSTIEPPDGLSGLRPSPPPATAPTARHVWPTAPDIAIAYAVFGAGGADNSAGLRVWTLYGDGRYVTDSGTFQLTSAELDAYRAHVERSGVLDPPPAPTPGWFFPSWSGIAFHVDGRTLLIDGWPLADLTPLFPGARYAEG